MMRICLIFNPRAGTAERIRDFLLQLTGGQRCELRPTSRDRSARQIAREAVDDGFDRIIAAGGDGTISEIVNGIAPQFDSVELAVLPFGTGNDLARVLGFPADQMDAACAAAFERHVVAIDVIRIVSEQQTSWCVNVANGGMGGRVAVDVRPDDKQRWGPMAYWMTSISRLTALQEFSVALRLDDRDVALKTYGLAAANGRFVGGGFPIAPRALLNDGFLDVTVLPVLPMFELLAAGMNFTLGQEHRDERVHHYRARRVEVRSQPEMPFSIDGETVCRMDAVFEVLPGVLRVAAHREAPGLIPAPETGPFID